MHPPIVLDVSHLITRLTQPATTGIDRVDLAYAKHFLSDPLSPCLSSQYGLFKPHILGPAQSNLLLRCFEEAQRENETTDTAEWLLLLSRLSGPTNSLLVSSPTSKLSWGNGWGRFAGQTRFRIFWDWKAKIPEGAIYLSVAQHAFEHDRFFRWLDGRPDVQPVFFIHDLLPLDFPEFFPAGYQERFLRRIRTMRRASALITSSQSVAARLRNEFEAHIHPSVRIHVEALPSPLENSPSLRSATEISGDPYFLMIGTIEPRKNHDLLLHVWRTLADCADFRARLVLVGKNGWENEQTIREIELTPELQGRVLRVSGLSPAHLKELISGAVALLMPSFAEGYGLPIVEALSLRTPVICSDIPVFHEVSQGKARFRKPFDGLGWRNDIVEMANPHSSLRTHCVDRAREFVAPTWSMHFRNIDLFLSSLGHARKSPSV